jgi:hypothetical protein
MTNAGVGMAHAPLDRHLIRFATQHFNTFYCRDARGRTIVRGRSNTPRSTRRIKDLGSIQQEQEPREICLTDRGGQVDAGANLGSD